MTLKEQLDALRAQSKARIPPEAQAIMQRSIEDIRQSGLLETTVKVGDPAPEFTLPNTGGQPVSLAGLRARGPVVLSFYRGRW